MTHCLRGEVGMVGLLHRPVANAEYCDGDASSTRCESCEVNGTRGVRYNVCCFDV